MSHLDDSLSAYAKVRVSVSIEDRVMAQVRAAAVRRSEARPVGVRQAAVLLTATLGVALVEAALWIGTLRDIRPPRLAPFSHALLQLFFVTLRLVTIVEQFLGALTAAAGAAITSPLGMAVALGLLLFSFVSFMAVYRRRRSATARGF